MMLELRVALTLMVDRFAAETERRVRSDLAGEESKRAVQTLREELVARDLTIEGKEALAKQLGTALSLRMLEIDQMKEHRKKQEVACAKLYDAVSNLFAAMPSKREWDREELERRRAIVHAELANAFQYCDQIPF